MKPSTTNKKALIAMLLLGSPIFAIAQPAQPGGGDPFATPVNGYIALVAVIAFFFGAFRIYQLSQRKNPGDFKD